MLAASHSENNKQVGSSYKLSISANARSQQLPRDRLPRSCRRKAAQTSGGRSILSRISAELRCASAFIGETGASTEASYRDSEIIQFPGKAPITRKA